MTPSPEDTVEKLRAIIAVEQARTAEATAMLALVVAERDLAVAQQRTAEAERDAYWIQICDTMTALGYLVPETAPHSVSWAKHTRESAVRTFGERGDLRQALTDVVERFEEFAAATATSRLSEFSERISERMQTPACALDTALEVARAMLQATA